MYKTLKLTLPRMKGDIVKYAQELLQQNGFSVGAIDGIYGPKSKEACINFQKKNGLVADGICGAKTWAALEAVNSKTPTTTESTSKIPNSPTTLDIQKRLIEWGFEPVCGAADGKMGTKTKTAIKHFQAAMSIKPTGKIDEATKKALWDEIIVPRIKEDAMMCQCVAEKKNWCNGWPKSKGYSIGVRILAERIFRKVEKTYPNTTFYVTSKATPSTGGGRAGGYRCSKWNSFVGGASGSQHKNGTAMDIYGKHKTYGEKYIRQKIEDVAMEMNTYGGVGYGAYYIVHIDIRGTKARWKY